MTERQIEAIVKFEERHFWYLARRDILHSVISMLDLPPDPNVLEIGPGGGANAKMLGSFGPVTLVEPSDLFRRHLEARGFTVIDAKLPALTGVDGSFDLICLFDVLEHVEDDIAALKGIAERLTSKGKIILTLPGCMFLYSQYDVSMGHFRRYSVKTLKNTARQAGLILTRYTYFNFFLMPLVMASRGWSALRGTEPKDVYLLPPSWINKVLLKIFRLEKYFIKTTRIPIGVSLLGVLESMN